MVTGINVGGVHRPNVIIPTASCIPLPNANRAVLAGDHKQLPAFSAREEPPESEVGMSLFEYLYADGDVFKAVAIRLKTQYRMAPDIAYFLNREFYDGDLRAGRAVEALESKEHAASRMLGGISGVQLNRMGSWESSSQSTNRERSSYSSSTMRIVCSVMVSGSWLVMVEKVPPVIRGSSYYFVDDGIFFAADDLFEFSAPLVYRWKVLFFELCVDLGPLFGELPNFYCDVLLVFESRRPKSRVPPLVQSAL